MPLGLLGAALSGGGQAVQQNAQSRIKQMHDSAMEKMRQTYQTKSNDKQWERETERSDGLIQKEREWQVSDNQANQEHEVKLANIRASSGGGSRGYAPGPIEKDIEYFKAQGYPQPEAEQRALVMRGRATDSISGLRDAIESMDTMLGDYELQANMEEDEIKQLRDDRSAAYRRLQELQRAAFQYGGQSSPELPPARNRPPQVGDMVGNPDPTDGVDEEPPPARPRREVGRRPGPSDPDAQSEAILREIGL